VGFAVLVPIVYSTYHPQQGTIRNTDMLFWKNLILVWNILLIQGWNCIPLEYPNLSDTEIREEMGTSKGRSHSCFRRQIFRMKLISSKH
jgi:hypothetical protein